MAAQKPSMDVYYKQGSAEYGKQLAAYEYEMGDKNAQWVDPVYGLLKYSDYLNPSQSVNKVAYENMAANPTVFSPGTGGYATKNEILGGTANPNSVGLNPTIQNGVVSSTPMGSVQGGQTGQAKTADQIAFESLYPGKTYIPPTGSQVTPSTTSTADKSPTRTATNTVKGYDTNNNWAEVWVPAGKYVPGVSLYPNKTTPSSLESSTSVTLPGAEASGMPTGTEIADSLVTGAGTSIAEIIKSLTPPETEADKKQQDILDKMTSLIGEQANKAADQLTAEQSAGLPDLRQQFADINGQILTKTAEYNVLQTANQNKPITLNTIIGNERAILNAKAADIGLLQAQALGLQGKIQTAQDTVNRAIDLKYSSIEAKLNIFQAQLNALQPILNKQEKQQALAQQIILDKQKQDLADQKAEAKAIQDVMLEAVKAGVTDTSVLNSISNAQSYQQAIQAAAPSLSRISSTERALENTYKSAQIQNILSEIQNRGLTNQLDPANALAYINQYASTGQIPTGLPKGAFGLIAEGAKELPKQNGTLVNSITGVKDSKLTATEQDDISRLYNITKLGNELLELDKQRVGGLLGGTLGKVFGSDAQTAYITKRKAIVDEIQRMQSGAALTEEEQTFYKDYLPGRFSEVLGFGQDSDVVIGEFNKIMNDKLNNILKNNSLSIYGYSKVNINGQEYNVGDVIEANGQKGMVLPDGSISVQSAFNTVGGDTKLSALGQSIVAQESGGNYKSVGQIPAGMTEADRALGKYQIVPKYHFAKIGLSNTPADRQKFLNSPQLQDQLFNIILNELSSQYGGDPKKIAAAYYGGDGAARIVGTKAADKPQYAGGKPFPSINQYVNSVISRIS